MDMKKSVVIYVSSLRRGGAEKIAIRLAKGLERHYHITLMVNTLEGHNTYTYEGDNLINLNIEAPSHSFWKGIINNFSRIEIIRKALKDCKADIIICFGTKQSILVSLLKLVMGIKIVAYEQTILSDKRIGKLWYNLYKMTYALVDHIVIQTNEGFEMILDRYKKKSVVIGNPIEIQDISRLEGIIKTNTLVSMGRLMKVKAFDYLIKVFNTTKDEHNWNLDIWGQGPEKDNLLALIKAYNLEDRVHLKGITMDPLGVLSASKIFVLTSEAEGFPNALAEAMSVGLPCISVDCPTGPKDLLSQDVGILIDRTQPAEMSKAIVTLINDEQQQIELGKRGLNKIQEFDEERIMRKWVTVLDAL
jgi:glycosyltransferase involved in cell wall biosynthesis